MPAGATWAPGPRCMKRCQPTAAATWPRAMCRRRIRDSCYLYSESRLVAAVGLNDHVVVETKDAVLVAPKDRVQDVKQLVARLKAEGRDEHSLHREVYRPVGQLRQHRGRHRFQVKRLTVKPGAQLSLQMHHHRAEHWIVVSGYRAHDAAARRSSCWRKTSPPISRSARSIASRIPARCRCTSSRCSRAATWARTTSCGSRTATGAKGPAPS